MLSNTWETSFIEWFRVWEFLFPPKDMDIAGIWGFSEVASIRTIRTQASINDYLVVSNIFYFHPYLGDMIQFDEHIFQMGCFNHQLVSQWLVGRLMISEVLSVMTSLLKNLEIEHIDTENIAVYIWKDIFFLGIHVNFLGVYPSFKLGILPCFDGHSRGCMMFYVSHFRYLKFLVIIYGCFQK